MSDKNENQNVFRFSLYQEDLLLGEKMFDADSFNPFTRYSIDIRDLLPYAITRFQRVLSKKQYDVNLYVGQNVEYDLYSFYKDSVYDKKIGDFFKYNPRVKEYQIDDKKIRGVECKLGLYINENPIVERMFYVDGFNPVARFSVDLLQEVVDVADEIFNSIKKDDVKNMWDDYDLINIQGLSINQIRELSPYKRAEILRKMRR
jgi:hypothetical protein